MWIQSLGGEDPLKEGMGCIAWRIHPSSLVVQRVKNPPVVWETCVQSLGWEDPLEKAEATHSGILAWRMPWTV